MAMLMSVSALTLVGCSSDDDDDNPSSSNTIQINGKSYELDTYLVYMSMPTISLKVLLL